MRESGEEASGNIKIGTTRVVELKGHGSNYI
jgi:hypothetical protein